MDTVWEQDGHERAADQSPALAEKDAADDDQQRTETAGYAAEHQHHVSSDRARSTARR